MCLFSLTCLLPAAPLCGVFPLAVRADRVAPVHGRAEAQLPRCAPFRSPFSSFCLGQARGRGPSVLARVSFAFAPPRQLRRGGDVPAAQNPAPARGGNGRSGKEKKEQGGDGHRSGATGPGCVRHTRRGCGGEGTRSRALGRRGAVARISAAERTALAASVCISLAAESARAVFLAVTAPAVAAGGKPTRRRPFFSFAHRFAAGSPPPSAPGTRK
ncbi:uncharacterized protein Tco025E_04396, partial [Trypanosoma conorhini]